MSKYFKITDFNMMNEDCETDLREPIIIVGVKDISNLPDCIVNRFEHLINRTICEHKTETETPLSLRNMELSMYINADTIRGELSLNVCISYATDRDWISGTEIIIGGQGADEDYLEIRQFFLLQIMQIAIQQATEIQKSIS